MTIVCSLGTDLERVIYSVLPVVNRCSVGVACDEVSPRVDSVRGVCWTAVDDDSVVVGEVLVGDKETELVVVRGRSVTVVCCMGTVSELEVCSDSFVVDAGKDSVVLNSSFVVEGWSVVVVPDATSVR
ncbi:unnamed protein product [Haemonchus placei]|uniref:Uncharacterized protein n=1 Tax=Haemonchus placei TaxID=6290 RepID=A0A0N4WZ91_HAEPC|nr:unnamed protein product [Haemonchus placei]